MASWQDTNLDLQPTNDLEDQEQYKKKKGPCEYPEGDDLTPDRYAAYSREQMDERLEEQRWYRVTATQNMLFLAGLQWWRYNKKTGSFEMPEYPPWAKTPVRNLLIRYFQFMLAKYTKGSPRYRAVPELTDPDNLWAAALADEVLQAKWDELRWTKTLRQALGWMIATGNGYTMTYWNTHSGKLEPLTAPVEGMWYDEDMNEMDFDIRKCPCDANGDPIMDEDGNYDLEAPPAHIDVGEVGRKALSPFQVFIDNDATTDNDVEDVVVAEALDIDMIHKRWPDSKGADIEPEDVSELTRFDNLVVGITTAGSDTHLAGFQVAEVSEQKESRKCLVLHRFERPSEDYPGGRHWVTAGKNHLLVPPGELPDRIWPAVVHYKEIEVPGQWLGDCNLTHAVGLQREYNEICGMIKEHHALLLRGKWLVPRGSLLVKGAITTEPGQVLQHTPTMRPEMQDLKPLPDEVYREREKVMADFERITGANVASMGAPPPGVTSGRGFLVLQEADNDDMKPVADMIGENVAQEAFQVIKLIQKNYEEERVARFSGKNRSYQTRAFRGADLSAIVAIKPVAGSAMPWSQTATAAQTLEVAKVFPQAFLDPMTGTLDPDLVKRAMPVGAEDALAPDVDEDIQKALREEELFEGWDGNPETAVVLPQPETWHDHHIHMRQHRRRLNSGTFEEWPEENQKMFKAHYHAHEALLQQQLMVRAQQMMVADLMAQGQAGGQGTPPGDGGGGMPPEQGANLHSSEMPMQPTAGGA